MSTLPLHYIDLRIFAYATEDEDVVREALRVLVPEDVDIERAESEGHYGDPIVVLSARIETADGMRSVLDQLRDVDLDRVTGELDDRVDENCAFYLTLDKQAAAEGRVRLGDGITLRAKVEAYPATQDAAIQNAKTVLSRC